MADDQDPVGGGEPGSSPSEDSGDSGPIATDSSARWVIWLIVAAVVFVGGGVFYHLSSENSDRWFLEVRDGQVVVLKGIWFPAGAVTYDAGGPAYAPIPLPEGMAAPAAIHESLESVDNAIYRLLIASAAGAIEAGDGSRIQAAKALLSRARLLAGISEQQADEVLRYRGDIAMAEGHLAIREVQKLLARARQRVESGMAKGTRLYKDPEGWIRWIDAKLAEFSSLDDAREPPASLCPEPIVAAAMADPEPPPYGELPAGPSDLELGLGPPNPATPAPLPAPSPDVSPGALPVAPPSTAGATPPAAPAADPGLSFPLFPEAVDPAPSPSAPEAPAEDPPPAPVAPSGPEATAPSTPTAPSPGSLGPAAGDGVKL